MRSTDKRMLAWLTAWIFFFPVWIGIMHLLHALLHGLHGSLGLALPRGFEAALYFLTLPAVLMPISALVRRIADRLDPARHIASASWDKQGNRSAAARK